MRRTGSRAAFAAEEKRPIRARRLTSQRVSQAAIFQISDGMAAMSSPMQSRKTVCRCP